MDNKLFLFKENKKSDKLVVIFSGVNAKSFMGYKLVDEFDCNKIFIREESKSWYHSCIDGVSNNIEELITYIETFTSKFKKENITFIGSSMGAYAALLVGIKLNVGKIIAFGPQIFINKNFPNNPKDDSYIKYKDLSLLINSTTSSIDILIGVNELVDLYHIKDIKIRKNINIYKIFGQPHNVMLFLNKLDLLKPYVQNTIFNKNYDLSISKNMQIDFNDDKYLEKAVELFFIEKDYKNSYIYFNKLIKRYPSVNTFWKYAAICSFYLKKYDEAIKFFNNAQLIVFRDDELHYYLGLLYFNQKYYDKSWQEFKYALDFSIDKKINYFIKLSISLRELKRYDEALKVLHESLKINSKNFGTYYQIAQIYKRQNLISKAIENLEIANKLKPTEQLIIDEIKELKN